MARRWRNWCGLVEARPAVFERPADLEGAVRAVKEARAAGRPLRVVGSGHSFTDLAETDGTLVSLDRLRGLCEVDRERARAVVWAGTTLRELGRLLDGHGLAMENLGDIDAQSLAGAISTGTHGTGMRLGNLSTQVVSLTLLDAQGRMVECAEEREPETFRAARVSLGALGVIVKVGLQLVPAYRLRYVRRRESFEACAAGLDRCRETNRHFELYYFPHTETVQVKLMNPTEAADDGRRLAKTINDLALENGAFGLLSRACRLQPRLCAPVSRLCAALVSEGDEVGASHRLFTTRRLVRFYEMEYALPAERGLFALRAIKDWIRREKIAVHVPLELRFVRGDDIPLSPSYGRDTAYLAVHMYQGMPYRRYFEGAERILRAEGGRPHWGKLHTLTAAELAPLYPLWERFQEIRRRLDPDGLFMNACLRRLFGGHRSPVADHRSPDFA